MSAPVNDNYDPDDMDDQPGVSVIIHLLLFMAALLVGLVIGLML